MVPSRGRMVTVGRGLGAFMFALLCVGIPKVWAMPAIGDGGCLCKTFTPICLETQDDVDKKCGGPASMCSSPANCEIYMSKKKCALFGWPPKNDIPTEVYLKSQDCALLATANAKDDAKDLETCCDTRHEIEHLCDPGEAKADYPGSCAESKATTSGLVCETGGIDDLCPDGDTIPNADCYAMCLNAAKDWAQAMMMHCTCNAAGGAAGPASTVTAAECKACLNDCKRDMAAIDLPPLPKWCLKLIRSDSGAGDGSTIGEDNCERYFEHEGDTHACMTYVKTEPTDAQVFDRMQKLLEPMP